jgi:hypothetical protein
MPINQEINEPQQPSTSGQQPVVVAGTTKGSGLAVTSLILGIIALLLAFIPIVNNFAFPLALIGLTLGVIGWVGARRGKRTGKGMAIVGVALAVLALAGVLASQAFYGAVLDEAVKGLDKATGGATEQVLADELNVTLGQFTITKDEFGLQETALPVTLINKGDTPLSFDITVEAIDASGNRIATDTAYADKLAPGQSYQTDLFVLVDDATAAKLTNATFRITAASSY